MGHRFIKRTDQQALIHLLDQKSVSPVQQKWITKLMGLNYEIQYKKGSENRVADALSRLSGDIGECYATTTVIPSWLQDVINSYAGDVGVQHILTSKQQDSNSLSQYTLDGPVIRYKGRLFVGEANGCREKILTEMHASPYGGHSGVQGTYMRLKSFCFWPHMKQDVADLVKNCDVCARNKPDLSPYPGLLQPLPIPDQPWSHISMDFVEGLPKSQGKDVILVVVDRLTKYGHFLPLAHPYTSQTVAKLFLDNVYKLHGMPVSIVTDRDKVFTSSFWKELFSILAVTLNFSTAYHPQSDGQTERLNQCVETYLRCMTSATPKYWSRWLSLAEHWYNTNYHSATKTTPFQSLYGYPPPYLSMAPYFDSTVGDVKDYMLDRQLMLRSLKENLAQAQGRMKLYADQGRTEREFQVGEYVYLKLQPYRQTSVSLHRNLKLASRLYGPYKILKRIGPVAYELELPADSKIHPVFHVSLLKKSVSEGAAPVTVLPTSTDEGLFHLTPSKALDRRSILRGGNYIPQILVQ